MGAPTVIHPTGDPITEAGTGWPVTTTAYVSQGAGSVEVVLTDPERDETVSVLDLTPNGAIHLAAQLVELAREVIREEAAR